MEPQVPGRQLLLLIDDDLMITEALASAMERENRTIITCNDVESAQLIVEQLNPSHIVTDVRISGPFGFEGLDFIHHARQHSPESRVILMTGDGPEALQIEASLRGAVAFLRKPFEVLELESVLERMTSSALSSADGYGNIVRMPLLDEILTSSALLPFFQPIVALDGTAHHIGYEALARYRTDSPFRNPEVLFNYAVRKKRVGDLEMACMKRSLDHGARLASAGPLFLNIHPDAFRLGERFRDGVIDRARQARVPLEHVVLEITEQGSLHDDKVVLDAITDLQTLGVRFAFDDVGVAYSHLPFIGKIRPNFLKISQHFGTAFETDLTKTKIVANLNSLARDFNCDLILEGIEEAATAEAAADLRIRYGQGFFFGHPADASEFSGK